MKYLIISDAASMHVYNFIKNMLLGRGYEIYVLRHSIRKIPEQYEKFYKENNITVFSPGTEDEGRSKIDTAKRFLRKIHFMRRLGKIDICHIHYLHRSSCLLCRLFKRNIDKLILSYWGTDILKPTDKEIKAQEKCFQYADKITVTVAHSKKVFVERYGTKYNDKLCFGRITSGSIPAIKAYAETVTKQQCRESMKIPERKICIVCGYSADPSQHQDICLEEIAMLPMEYKAKIHILIPVQYDRISLAYIENVKKQAANCGCTYDVLEEYVPFERNATMCLATDIFLQLRDSDAFSNAMKEQVYSGSFMIQGSWLIYEELDQCGAPVVKIDHLNELHETLSEILKSYSASDEIRLFEPLYNIFSMDKVRGEWDELLASL
ncbi:MAG: hypothetical protein J1F23_03335 [Oscillospiraceae bacterium]|nr:hypothetical protein [Oscillospiraceae bacterium]